MSIKSPAARKTLPGDFCQEDRCSGHLKSKHGGDVAFALTSGITVATTASPVNIKKRREPWGGLVRAALGGVTELLLKETKKQLPVVWCPQAMMSILF